MLMPAAMVMHYGVVLREENYLERRFGEVYRQYMAAVTRYGWRFARRRGMRRSGVIEAVQPFRIVHQYAATRRLIRNPNRDLIDQVAVVRHRRFQLHMRPVRAPY